MQLNGGGNGSLRRERRHFTAQQKVALVKRHLLDGVAVSLFRAVDQGLTLLTNINRFNQLVRPWHDRTFRVTTAAAASLRQAAPRGPRSS